MKLGGNGHQQIPYACIKKELDKRKQWFSIVHRHPTDAVTAVIHTHVKRLTIIKHYYHTYMYMHIKYTWTVYVLTKIEWCYAKIILIIRQKEEFKEYYDKNNVIIILNILVQNGIFFKLDQLLVGSTFFFLKKIIFLKILYFSIHLTRLFSQINEHQVGWIIEVWLYLFY